MILKTISQIKPGQTARGELTDVPLQLTASETLHIYEIRLFVYPLTYLFLSSVRLLLNKRLKSYTY